jgi:hypothetical protein
MPEASFYFNSTYNKCTIDPTEINSVGGPENPAHLPGLYKKACQP